MTRILKLAAIFLSVISLASAQFVDTLNTPLGPVTQGAKVPVTWTLLAGVDPGAATGDLSAADSATKNVISIDPAVPLAPKSFLWEVKVPPGTYTLGLNDGSGLKQSGEVVVKAPAAGAPAPGGGAPAPGGGAPAPGGGAPAPGGGAPNPPAPPPAAAVSGGPDTPAPAGSPTSTGTYPSDTSKTGSASSIFSGYEIVFSLSAVAIAMVQF